MTYRQKLLLKRFLIILVIVVIVVAVALYLGFTYLGRYVVYTEDGAYFSFDSISAEEDSGSTLEALSSIELVTGEPISAAEVVTGTASPADTDVNGVLVDYTTLSDGSTLNEIELGSASNNTLVMEMRASDEALLSTDAVQRLISRAQGQDVWLVAMISCLSDSDYALEHPEQAIQISGGALWMSSDGSYWLDPAQDEVLDYLAETITALADMGFDEVILTDFYLPSSSQIVYDYDGETSESIMTAAYNDLLDASLDVCQLALLIEDPDEGHPAFDAADRIYVCYEDGATVKSYAESHTDQYLVFVTSSHDTRFDAYGKIQADGSFIVDSDGSDAEEEEPEEDVVDDTGEAEDEDEM